jgi:hypothetical protein
MPLASSLVVLHQMKFFFLSRFIFELNGQILIGRSMKADDDAGPHQWLVPAQGATGPNQSCCLQAQAEYMRT